MAESRQTDSSGAVFDREKWEFERQLREREVAIRERELGLKRDENQRSRWTNPLVLAVLAAALAASGNFVVAWWNGKNQYQLELFKADSGRILQVFDTSKGDLPVGRRLQLLVDAKLISDEALRKGISTALERLPYDKALSGACQLPPTARADLDLRWLNAGCSGFYWPPYEGFDGGTQSCVIKSDDSIERYGNEFGRFFHAAGTLYSQTSLPYEEHAVRRHQYRVLKDFLVTCGRAARWFDQPGGALQYKADKSADQLVREGYLQEISPKRAGAN